MEEDSQNQEGLTPRAFHSKRPHKKSRSGCIECKRRKVKCNEARPACRSCVLRKSTCRYPEADDQRSSIVPYRQQRSSSSSTVVLSPNSSYPPVMMLLEPRPPSTRHHRPDRHAASLVLHHQHLSKLHSHTVGHVDQRHPYNARPRDCFRISLCDGLSSRLVFTPHEDGKQSCRH